MRLLYILLSCCMFTACTITKRHFGSGYHVEWKRNPQKANEQAGAQDQSVLKRHNSTENKPEIESPVIALAPETKESDSIKSDDPDLIKNQVIETVKPVDGVKPVEEVRFVDMRCMAHPQVSRRLSAEKQNKPDSYTVPQKTEPFTIVSLAIFVGIGISLALISVFSSFLYLGAGAFIGGLVLVMFLFSLASFIRIHREPNRYKNKRLTNFMFILSMVCVVVAAVYLLAVVAVSSMSPMLQGI